MMRREIDNPEAFEEMRHLYARVQTEVVREAGLNITYTALSNVERGLPNAPQKHLGGERTARVRRGEQDAVNEANWERMLAGEAALLDERLRHNQERAAAEQALNHCVQERTAVLAPDLAGGPSLAIAALEMHAEPVADLSLSAASLGAGPPNKAPMLAIADLQAGNRSIVDIRSLYPAWLSRAAGTPNNLHARSAVPDANRSIAVPQASTEMVAATAPVLPLPAARARAHTIAATPRLVTERAFDVTPMLPLGSARMTSERFGSALVAVAALKSVPVPGYSISLSLSSTGSPPRRLLNASASPALVGGAVDRELESFELLFAARKAEVEVRREGVHRTRTQHTEVESARSLEAERQPRTDEIAHSQWSKAQFLAKHREAALETGRGVDTGAASGDSAAEVRGDQSRAAQAEVDERVTRATQASEGERGTVLVKAQMDEWIDRLMRANRRLIVERNRIVPEKPTERDLAIMSAANYSAMASALKRMKRTQDDAIETLTYAFGRDPNLLVVGEKDGRPTYELAQGQRGLRAALAYHRDDPALAKAVAEAVGRQQRASAGATDAQQGVGQGAAPTRANAHPTVVGSATVQPPVERMASASSAQSQGTPAPQLDRFVPTALELALVRLQEEGIRIYVEEGKAKLNLEHIQELNVSSRDLLVDETQKRLIAVAQVQERERERVTAFARANPDMVAVLNSRTSLMPHAPPELVAVAEKWSRDPIHNRTLMKVVEAARQERARAVAQTAPSAVPPDLERQQPEQRGGQTTVAPERPVAERTVATRPADTIPLAVQSSAASVHQPPVVKPAMPPPMSPPPAPQVTAPATPEQPKMVPVTHDEEDWKTARLFKERQRQERVKAEQHRVAEESARNKRAVEARKQVAEEASQAKRVQVKGVHELIDQWIKAVQGKLPADKRERAALRVVNDAEARRLLDELVRPDLAVRIRADAKKAQDSARVGLGRPPEPRGWSR